MYTRSVGWRAFITTATTEAGEPRPAAWPGNHESTLHIRPLLDVPRLPESPTIDDVATVILVALVPSSSREVQLRPVPVRGAHEHEAKEHDLPLVRQGRA